MNRPIVAIAGLIGAGKTTVAMHLCENHNFRRVRFAGPLKDMIAALGLSREEIDGSLKETPCDLLGGQTPRHAMQTLGTEWGRQMIVGDLWIRAWRRAVAEVPEGVGVVVDDMRFPNEAAEVRKFPRSTVVRIARTGPRRTENYDHPSELQTFEPDVTIYNDSTIEALLSRVDRLVMVPA